MKEKLVEELMVTTLGKEIPVEFNKQHQMICSLAEAIEELIKRLEPILIIPEHKKGSESFESRETKLAQEIQNHNDFNKGEKMEIKTELNFGDKVEEKITGFKGIATGFCCYITGCNQFLVTPKCKKNEVAKSLWFDEGRLKKIENKLSEKDVKGATNGCDIEAPIK